MTQPETTPATIPLPVIKQDPVHPTCEAPDAPVLVGAVADPNVRARIRNLTRRARELTERTHP